MRYLSTSICLAMSVLIAGSAWAEDEAPNGGDRRAEMRKRIMEEFDADGDGELSDDERAKARDEMRSRRGDRAGKGQGENARGNRMRRGGAEGQPQGRRGGQLEPGKLFDKFDANSDGQLSLVEFKELSEEVRANRRPRGPEGGAGGARPDGPPPREGGRRFQSNKPLQNQEDQAERPPRAEGRRRLNDEEGQAARGPREGGRRGQRGGQRGGQAGGPEGNRPPSPEAVFNRFDANGDKQLSRDEFMKLSDRMRQMQDGRGGPGGARGGRGAGRGGPQGEEGQNRPRRPARPQFDDDANVVAPTDDNSV